MHRTIGFKKKALSSCIAACTMAALGTAAIAQEAGEQEGTIDEIVVTGIRGSQKAAIDVKRNSANIVDSIVAEDIGKLPDVTIADSLQRITGIQIDRTAGEGSSLNVRGMPQVLTTLNGEQFLSPWSITGIQANYSDIPSSMISGIDVHKSMSASLLAGGISGLIDLKTRKGLSLDEGWTASVGVEGSEGSITKDANHDINAFVGWNNGDLAFTLGGFTSITNAANYQAFEDSRMAWPNLGGDPTDLNNNGNTTNDRFLVPAGYGVKAYVMERERSGLATSFQANINDSFKLTGEVFYTKMDQYDRGVQTQFNGSNDSNYDVLRPGSITQQEAIVAASNGTPERAIHSVQLAVVEAPDFQATTSSLQNHTDAINTNLELAFDNGGAFTGSVRYVHADAEKNYEQATFQQGTPEWYFVDEDGDGQDDPLKPFNVIVDYRGEFPTFTYADNLSSPERLNLYQAFSLGQKDEAALDVFRADGSYEFEFVSFDSVDFGLRYGSRDVTTTKYDYLTPTAYYSTWADPAVDEELWFQPLPGDKVWQRYPDWRDFKGNPGIGLSEFTELKSQLISYDDFGPFGGFETGVAGLDPKSLDDVQGFMDFVYPGTQKFADPAKAYSVKEESTSAYVQANFDNQDGVFGIPFSGNLGVQVIQTDRTVTKGVVPVVYEPGSYYGGGPNGEQAYNAIFKSLGSEVSEVSFTDVLPAANINFFPHDDVVVRLSYAETMTRNDLVNVGEGLTLWYQEYRVADPEGDRVDENGNPYRVVTGPGGGNDQGNPNVEPWRANNYNLSTEWYFAEDGILSVGVFLIEVDNATQTLQEQRQYPDADGVVRRDTNIWTTKNVGASDLTGFELGYKQAFTFLPGPLDGLGMEFNYTYSDSESGDVDLTGESFPLQSNSEHQYNAILWYQKDKLSTRIAYNWRSEQFNGRVGLNTNEAPISLGNWTEPSGYLDASINYDVIENITVYLQGTNITETNKRSYAQFEDQFHSISAQERRIALGIRARI